MFNSVKMASGRQMYFHTGEFRTTAFAKKMLEGAVCWGVGDVAYQFGYGYYVSMRRDAKASLASTEVQSTKLSQTSIAQKWDHLRSFRQAVFGGLVFIPLRARWYTSLERVFPTPAVVVHAGSNGAAAAATRRSGGQAQPSRTTASVRSDGKSGRSATSKDAAAGKGDRPPPTTGPSNVAAPDRGDSLFSTNLKRIASDQLIFTPVVMALYFAVLAMGELSAVNMLHRAAHGVIEASVWSTVFWLPAQFVAYRYIPRYYWGPWSAWLAIPFGAYLAKINHGLVREERCMAEEREARRLAAKKRQTLRDAEREQRKSLP